VRQVISVFEQQEYVKCKFDVIYFIKKYVQIISLDEGVVPFHLFPYQEKMIKHMEDNRFSIFMTSRQMGKTTVAAGYILHELIFNKSFTVAILANKGAQAREIMERVQMMYEELPFFLQPGVKSWNKGSISLGNKSRAFTAATSSSSVRGKSINLLYMDEFAHIENDTEFYQSTYPVIMSGKTTKVIITSTPNGMNLFYKIWTEAKDGRSQYKALQIER
jgi:phage terminase large subunit-like protein